LIAFDDESIFDFSKTLTLEIEANMYHRFSKNISANSPYSQRSKALALNLKNSSNTLLRKKVLLKTIKASDLCTMPEEDLVP